MWKNKIYQEFAMKYIVYLDLFSERKELKLIKGI